MSGLPPSRRSTAFSLGGRQKTSDTVVPPRSRQSVDHINTVNRAQKSSSSGLVQQTFAVYHLPWARLKKWLEEKFPVENYPNVPIFEKVVSHYTLAADV